jgi:hypothetical protein
MAACTAVGWPSAGAFWLVFAPIPDQFAPANRL